MQEAKNEMYFEMKKNAVRRSIGVLSTMLKQAQLQQQEEDTVRAEYGQIRPADLWKVGRSRDNKLFDCRKKRESSNIVVDILLDSSGSETQRQPQIAVQAYLISQAFSNVGIPHRVSSSCSYWEYTIVHRFRQYDDTESSNRNILQFRAFGNNRDGLAIRSIVDDFKCRSEEKKILIILSDGRPNAVGLSHSGMEPPIPYVGELAVRDTALEVRKARNLGISVLGIFIGDEEDLAIERKIFGKEFVYTQKIESFAHIVGTYLRKQMEQD
jgi:nitric oxide reductase activation protein